jgi:hypothetical protein
MARAVPEDTTIFNVAVFGCDNARVMSDVEYMQENVRKITKRDITFTEVLDLFEWKLNVRMAETFCVGRVFLAGGTSSILLSHPCVLTYCPSDAAHVHSPAGGQGMNSGVQDAVCTPHTPSSTHSNLFARR